MLHARASRFFMPRISVACAGWSAVPVPTAHEPAPERHDSSAVTADDGVGEVCLLARGLLNEVCV